MNTYLLIIIICLVAKLSDVILTQTWKKLIKRSIGTIYLRNILRGIIYVTAVILIFFQFKITTKILHIIFASSTLLIAVLGFAAQESLSNFIHGVSIMLFKPFDVGQRITLRSKNITGIVTLITLRHTVIKTYTNSFIAIPNSRVDNDDIENYHAKDAKSRGFIDIDISLDSDVQLAIQTLQLCIANYDLSIKKVPDEADVYVRDILNNRYSLRGEIWTSTIDENFKACSDIRIQVIQKFKEFGIELAKPQSDLYISSVPSQNQQQS